MNTTVVLFILIAAGIAGVYGKNFLCVALVLFCIFGPIVNKVIMNGDHRNK